MGDSGKRSATYEDLCRVPEGPIAELLDGELVTQPRPASRHARASSVLGGELAGPGDRARGGGPGGWVILDGPELHLGRDVLVRERMPEIPDVAAFQLAPDSVGEVLSPTTAVSARVRRMPIYGREGVAQVWLIHPLAKTLEVFGLENGRWVVLGTWCEDARVRASPFEVFELELGALWAR